MVDGQLRAGSARNRWRPVLVAMTLAALVAVAAPAAAAPPPSPLPWQRTYVSEASIPDDQLTPEIAADCQADLENGVHDNGAPGVPRIGVLGDSVADQTRTPLMFDAAYRWTYATHCGEKFGTAVDSGRAGDIVNTHPDVVVIALGPNDLTEFWQVRPDFIGPAISNLNRLLDATESVPCRVIINLPDNKPDFVGDADNATWLSLTAQLNGAENAAQARHGVHVADWAGTVDWYWPAYLQDGLHLTGIGVNARINLAIQTARQCLPPDSPTNIGAVAANGTASVWWNPLPDPEKITAYKVTASDGRSITTSAPTVNFPGLTNGVAYQFTVSAINAGGPGPPSSPTGPVTPTNAGARFHALAPTRVLDTRDGTGGKAGAFGPGETLRLPVTGIVPAGTSAVVLNVTATGQSADTVVTAWPSGQSRPLASNLNPHPGVDGGAALGHPPHGPGGAIQLYNGAGNVHLIADVIGYYGAPGATTGSLYDPVAPTRLLDTRDGTGGKTGKFGSGETYSLPIPQLPAGATAAVLNVTSTNTTAPSFVTLWPHGQPRPLASNLNPQPGLTRANLTVAKTGPTNTVDLFNNSAGTDLIVDVVGYYTAEGVAHGGSLYYPITPERLYDTRFATGGIPGPISNANNLWLGLAGHGAIPTSGVTAIDANLTITNPSNGGHTTAWPTGGRPTTSNLNYQPGETIANRDPVALDGSGTALFWSAAPSINYIIDASGWWGPTL
jgi:hypothetical protein